MPDRPAILLVCRMSPRMNGRARALVEALEDDYDVTVVCEQPPRMGSSPVFRRARLVERRLAFGTRSLLHIGGLIRVLQMALLGLIYGGRTRASVVICADVPYCPAGLLAKWLWGSRFVFDAYEIFWGLGDGWLLSRLFTWLEKLVLRTCDLWLVPSEERAQIVLREQRLSLPYTVVPNLPIWGSVSDDIQQRLHQAGVPPGQPTLIFQGTLMPRRGLPELVKAAQSGRFHLIVQGDGPLNGFVSESAGPHVTVLPPCPNNEAVSWLSAATAAFVYYENDCVNSAYACSSKFYASMIAGTPVICNDLPAFRAFSEKHGASVILSNLAAQEIAAAVEAIARGSSQRLRSEAAAAGAVLKNYPRAETLRSAFRSLAEEASPCSH
jgi:glycosyltransferase involved in cell wall biosynthesis